MNRAPLDAAIISLLETVTSRPVGDSQIPNENPSFPYVVVYCSPSPRSYEGSWEDPNDQGSVSYQVKSVGRTRDQVSKLSDRVAEAFVGHEAGKSGYQHPLVPSGLGVIKRESVSRGAIMRTGDDLFQCDDFYEIEVSI